MKFYIRFTTETFMSQQWDVIRKLAKRAGLETSFREAPYDADIAIVTLYGSTDKKLKDWAKKHLPKRTKFSGPFANKSSSAQKENNMSEQAENILANIVQNKPILAAKSFKDVIDNKLSTALEVRKVGLTSDIYNKSEGLSEKRIDFEKTNKLSSSEYEKVQNFRNFDEKDWEWDAKESLYIRKNTAKQESVDLKEAVDNFFGFDTEDKLVKFQSKAKGLKIKPISNPTVIKRGGNEYHVMGFEGSVKDIEKAMKVAQLIGLQGDTYED